MPDPTTYLQLVHLIDQQNSVISKLRECNDPAVLDNALDVRYHLMQERDAAHADQCIAQETTTYYISGPITHDPDYMENFYAVELYIARNIKGARIINPAHNSIGDTEGMTEAEIWEAYMVISREQVKQSDIVVTLDGWQSSRGAREEVALAKQHNITVTPARELLP